MKLNIKSTICTVVLIFILYGLFVHSAYARRMHNIFDFNRMPEDFQQLREVLLKIEEFIPRIQFEQKFLDSPKDLDFVLGKMKENGITPEFILDFYRLVEGIETAASEKLNTTIKTDRIFFKPIGNNAEASLVSISDSGKISLYRIEQDDFKNKDNVSVLIFNLEYLFDAYNITGGQYKEALKALIAHELGHNLSDVETTGDSIRQMQSGFNSRYTSIMLSNPSPHNDKFPIGFVMNRLNEIIADTIAAQLTGLEAMRARDRFEGATVGRSYYLLQPFLDAAPRSYMTVYDAWRIAKARFLGLDDIADVIRKQLYMSNSISEHREAFQQLVEYFNSCFKYWGLNIPGG